MLNYCNEQFPDPDPPSQPHSALDRLQPRAVSHEEQITALREQLALVYERRELWSQAAQALAGIDLDSGVRLLDGEYRLEKNVRIARLYLEDDDPVAAETYIKKASSLVAAIKVRRWGVRVWGRGHAGR